MRQGVLSVSLDLEHALGHTVDDDVNELRKDRNGCPIQIQIRKVAVDSKLVLVLGDTLLTTGIEAQAVKLPPLIVKATLVTVFFEPLILDGLTDHKSILLSGFLCVRNKLTGETRTGDIDFDILHLVQTLTCKASIVISRQGNAY